MTITRFDCTEKTVEEMIAKLTSNKHIDAQNVFYKIVFNAGAKVAECFLRAVDGAGLYDERITLFHKACGSSLVNTMEAVFYLQSLIRGGKISQDSIIRLTNQEQFNYFVTCNGILKHLEEQAVH